MITEFDSSGYSGSDIILRTFGCFDYTMFSLKITWDGDFPDNATPFKLWLGGEFIDGLIFHRCSNYHIIDSLIEGANESPSINFNGTIGHNAGSFLRLEVCSFPSRLINCNLKLCPVYDAKQSVNIDDLCFEDLYNQIEKYSLHKVVAQYSNCQEIADIINESSKIRDI